MENHKEPKKSKQLTVQEKAHLRALLSDLLERAEWDPDAAQSVLRASMALRVKVPLGLLTRSNLASSFSLNEISTWLDRLSFSGTTWDLSAALHALQDLAKRQQPHPKALLLIAKTITARLTKMVTPRARKSKLTPSALKLDEPVIVFTGPTLLSASDLVLWMIPRLFDAPSSPKAVYVVALRLIQMVEIIWRRSCPPSESVAIVSFLRSLPSVVPRAIYRDLEDEPSIVAFTQDAHSALTQDAERALLEAKIRKLEKILTFAKKDGKRGEVLVSYLEDICRDRPSEVLPEAVELIARETERNSPKIKTPTAADESQASALNYVGVCLLAAWDAATEGDKAVRALESTKRLARELFKVDLTGTPGQILQYDERQHELSSPVKPVPTTVQLIRPGVRWSDGVRTRFLIRAIVEPTR